MRLPLVVSMFALAACGRDTGDTVVLDAAPDTGNVVDQTVSLPTPDPDYVDYITPAAVVQPGETRMFCYHVEQQLPDFAVDQIRVLQGPHGHHVSVMTSTTPLPPGSFEDCTSPAANVNLRWLMLTTGPLPPGDAMNLPQGQRLVLQFHYLNPSDSAVLVNSVIRFHKVAPETVTTWVATTVATDVTIDLPPGVSHHTFDCRLSDERQLIGMFGHMHQYGTDIAIDIGPDADHLQRMMTVDEWLPEYFDDPPWRDISPPLTLSAGTVIRTSCSWMNPTLSNMQYPTEMCFTFTWLAGSKVPATCD